LQVIHQAIEMGWMTLSMAELCPKLAQYGIPEEACALIAFLFMTDMLEHIMPDPVLYCEKLHVCPSLPGGAAAFTDVTVVQVCGEGGSFAPRQRLLLSHSMLAAARSRPHHFTEIRPVVGQSFSQRQRVAAHSRRPSHVAPHQPRCR